MKKAAFHNLGCKVNAYEAEAMQQSLERAGYEIVPFTERADVYIVNTCTVTSIADKKSRQMLHRARSTNPEAIVVAAGCYVETGAERLREDPAVDLVIGNDSKGNLSACIAEYERARESGEKETFFLHDNRSGENPKGTGRTDGALVECRAGENCRGEKPAGTEMTADEQNPGEGERELFLTHTAEHTRAFLKVQDGCNQFCSYCIIPYARGRVRSRTCESVLREVQGLAESGCREVVLTGIHLSSYGTDRGESLLRLIREVHEVEGIDRIRLGSLEPKIVTEEFARELAVLPKLCPHFHLSLQSGCDATLQRMNRRYTTAEYEEGCRILRNCFEHPAITTDVIAGFPGETEEEFRATEEFVRRLNFYELHVFKYSRREGTRAAAMPEQIPEQVKAQRSAELIALGDEMSRKFREYYLGTEREVLFEEPAVIEGVEYYVGYTREYVKAACRSRETLENRLVKGRIVRMLTPEICLIEREY